MESTGVLSRPAGIKGQVIVPGDALYDEARTVFVGGVDRYPMMIVRVADATDVMHVVSLARETGLELAVRSGGHSSAGYGVSDGGIVLDLSNMRGLEMDLRDRTAWADTGLTTGEYTAMAATAGMATGFGDARSVGIGGLTLGGGVGLLTRKHGLTIDSLLAADVVTADGEIVRTDAETHPDLFWAIRGGGGNFGVATRFQFRLHEVEQVLGGMLFLPPTADVIEGFIAEAEAAPDELSTIVSVMPAPPLPFLPQEEHGRLVLMALVAYAGGIAAGERALAPLRALAEPIADTIRPQLYTELLPPDPEGFHPMMAARTTFLDGMDTTMAETILEFLEARTAPMAAAQLRVLGGAVSRVPGDATAFPNRDRRVIANLAAMYQEPGEASAHEAWVSDFAAALPGSGAYVNFLGAVGEQDVRAAYPGRAWERLAAVKAEYDPTNVFRLNHNIPPAE
jgi:FAD/FMN-containing dehydrogenase